MATTPGRKVRDGKMRSGHHSFDETPPYFGDAESFRSGSARADDHQPITRQASVEGEARQADMCDMPGKEFAYIPEEGNKAAKRTIKHLGKKPKGGDVSIHPGGGY